MANTQNLDLVKPLGTDHALVSVLNSNSDKIDAYAGAVNAGLDGLRDGLGILANGNTHAAITSGQYVYVKNHGSLPEGLYKATANIAANGTLSTSNLAADSAGGLNSLNEQIGTLAPNNSKVQINFNALQQHTIDIGIVPSSDKNASVLLIVANQGILSEISCTGNGAVKTDFGTAITSVSLSGSVLTINFASRPWGLFVALIHHN